MQTNISRTNDELKTLIQAKFKISFNINLNRPIDLDVMDDWLSSALDIEITDIEAQTTTLKDDPYQLAEALSWRILLLARSLLQAVRLPCFDLGDIVELKQDTQKSTQWNVTLHLVKIDNLPKNLYLSIIRSTIKIMFWIMEREKTQNNINILYSTIQNQVLQPFLGLIGAGKSTLPVLHVAHQKNIPFIHLGKSIYQLGWGSNSRRMQRSGIDLDSAIGAGLSNNKIQSAQLFRMAGLPVPVHGVAKNENSALKLAHAIGWPIVVKPADTDRGEGVTIGIKDEKQLLAAFRSAQNLSQSKQVIIEREVEGVCYRLFVENGKLLYAIKRSPKSVMGDGQKSVSSLISEANKREECKPPWLRDTPYPNDTLALTALEKSGFNLDSIPDTGVLAPLRIIESTASGGTFEDVTINVHPDNLDIALRAAQVCGLSVAGVDIITTDIQTPWHQSNAIINEINYTPLLGGNEISKRYIPLFLTHLISEDGRIPVEIVIGGGEATMDGAKKKQKSLIEKGLQCFLTSHKTTFSGYHQEMILPFQSLYRRCQALLIDKRVEALVLVVQTDEFLYTGMPIDNFTDFSITEEELTSFKSTSSVKLSEESRTKLLKLLKKYS